MGDERTRDSGCSTDDSMQRLPGRRSLARAVIVACALLSCGIVLGVSAATGPVATIKRMTGDVQVVHAGTATPTKLGARLEEKDELRTGRAASVGVTFSDNSIVSLGPNSRYVIERFDFDTTTHEGGFASRLRKGTLAMVTGKLAKQSPNAVTVNTPSTMLGVRGTTFAVQVP